jgi:hypothetical protein
MSDILDASVREATIFYLDSPETPGIDPETGELFITPPTEGIKASLSLLNHQQLEELVWDALAEGIVDPPDLSLPEYNRKEDVLEKMAQYALLKTMLADPSVRERRESNIRMLELAVKAS